MNAAENRTHGTLRTLILNLLIKPQYHTIHIKQSSLLRISLVNVNKSAISADLLTLTKEIFNTK